MSIIDDQGRLFGLVNVIDALVVLLVLAVVVSGISMVTSTNQTQTHTQIITFRTTPQSDYVVEAIPTGLVPTEDIVIVIEKSVTEQSGGLYVATVRVKLRVTLDGNVPMFDGERLYIGRSLRLDFGTTIVDGTVIDMNPVETTT